MELHPILLKKEDPEKRVILNGVICKPSRMKENTA